MWLLVIPTLAAAGCGASSIHDRTQIAGVITPGSINNFREGRKLVGGKLPGGGLFTVVAESQRYGGTVERRLSYYAEEPARYRSMRRKRGMVRSGGGGGVDLRPRLHANLEIVISNNCIGPYPYTLAYGVLHHVRDSVTAYTHATGAAVKFETAAFPSDLRVHGVLVYALLGHGQNHIVTRTASGRIVSDEMRPGIGVSCGK